MNPSTSLPVTANATPKRSLPIHIPEKDTPLLNCCQRISGALFKPFAELLPKHRPIPGLIPAQTPPHLHIVPFHIVPSPFMGGPSFYPLSPGERARVRASKTTPPLYLPIMNLVPLHTNPILPPLVLRKYYGKTDFQPNIEPNIATNIAGQHRSPHRKTPPLSLRTQRPLPAIPSAASLSCHPERSVPSPCHSQRSHLHPVIPNSPILSS